MEAVFDIVDQPFKIQIVLKSGHCPAYRNKLRCTSLTAPTEPKLAEQDDGSITLAGSSSSSASSSSNSTTAVPTLAPLAATATHHSASRDEALDTAAAVAPTAPLQTRPLPRPWRYDDQLHGLDPGETLDATPPRWRRNRRHHRPTNGVPTRPPWRRRRQVPWTSLAILPTPRLNAEAEADAMRTEELLTAQAVKAAEDAARKLIYPHLVELSLGLPLQRVHSVTPPRSESPQSQSTPQTDSQPQTPSLPQTPSPPPLRRAGSKSGGELWTSRTQLQWLREQELKIAQLDDDDEIAPPGSPTPTMPSTPPMSPRERPTPLTRKQQSARRLAGRRPPPPVPMDVLRPAGHDGAALAV